MLVVRARLSAVEGALFVAIALVFLFNNLGPPHPETDADARRVHPAHLPAARRRAHRLLRAGDRRPAGALDRPKATFVAIALGATLLANLSVAFGPIAHVPWAGAIYQRFYFHAYLDSMDTNLALYGRRPLGFCSPR